jgi:hypothetical protein
MMVVNDDDEHSTNQQSRLTVIPLGVEIIMDPNMVTILEH